MAPPVVVPPVATSIAPLSSTCLTAVPGSAITDLPSVIAKDNRGAGIPGVPVTFTVTGGGGTITGSSIKTNAAGIATVGGWTLGTVAGSNSLSASTNVLPSVTFFAVGTTDAAAPGGGPITSVLLPTLGGTFGDARAINDGGVVVGASTDNTDTRFAVRWTLMPSGSWSITRMAGPDSYAFEINANGVAVGLRAGRAKLWPAAGGEIDLGPHWPSGINSAETVVGRRIPNLTANPSQRAVVWRKPTAGWDLSSENAPQDLPIFPGGAGETGAGAINEAGVIVGAVGVSTATSAYYAVRWDPVGDRWAQPAALPGAEGFYVTAGRAINDNAQPDLAGHVRPAPQGSVFGMFSPTGSCGASLEPFFGGGSGFAEGMNNNRRVVGFRETQIERVAFVWWPGRTSLQELAGPNGYTDTWAFDINNVSPAQAVGNGLGTNGYRAIVWTLH